MKKYMRSLAGILTGVILCTVLSVSGLASFYDQETDTLDGKLLFPGDSMRTETNVWVAPDMTSCELYDNVWTNTDTERAYRVSLYENPEMGESGLLVRAEGYVVTVIGGVSSSDDGITGTHSADTYPEEPSSEGEDSQPVLMKDTASYPDSSWVHIKATGAGEGWHFGHWEFEPQIYLEDIASEELSFLMPAHGLKIKAVYSQGDGVSSGENTQEEVSADNPEEVPADQYTDEDEASEEGDLPEEEIYEGEDAVPEAEEYTAEGNDAEAEVYEENAAPDTLEYAAEENDAEAEAYEADAAPEAEGAAEGGSIQSFSVVVENGSGSGNYEVGDPVSIAANTSQEGTFLYWTTDYDTVWFENETASETRFFMPAENVVITAVYDGNAVPAEAEQEVGEIPQEAQTPEQTVEEIPQEAEVPEQAVEEIPQEAEVPEQAVEEIPQEAEVPEQAAEEITLEAAAQEKAAEAPAEPAISQEAEVPAALQQNAEAPAAPEQNMETAEAPAAPEQNTETAEVPAVTEQNAEAAADAALPVENASDAAAAEEKGAQDGEIYSIFLEISGILVNGEEAGEEAEAEEGAVVTLTAAGSEDTRIEEWVITNEETGEIIPYEEEDDENILFVMPAAEVSVSLQYSEILKNTVEVTGGQGSGTYEDGDKVIIEASPAPEGQQFKMWMITAGDITLDDVFSSKTGFTMGEEFVAVQAVYEPIFYKLTVNSGSGGGTYHKGDAVNISADWPADGKEFSSWHSDQITIDSADRYYASLVMPASDVTVSASYQDGPSAAYNRIDGLAQGQEYLKDTKLTFTAVGNGPDKPNPNPGDFKWVPASYQIGTVSGGWSGLDFSTSMSISATGQYTLTVVFVKQIFDGNIWTITNQTDQKSVTFYVVNALAVQTGDTTPVLPFAVAAAAALAVIVGIVIYRKKR